jgi:hypothetical protein
LNAGQSAAGATGKFLAKSEKFKAFVEQAIEAAASFSTANEMGNALGEGTGTKEIAPFENSTHSSSTSEKSSQSSDAQPGDSVIIDINKTEYHKRRGMPPSESQYSTSRYGVIPKDTANQIFKGNKSEKVTGVRKK